MHDPKHPVWILARQLLLCGVVCFALWFNYTEMDGRDATTILQLLLGSVGFDLLQRKLTSDKDVTP